jgi:predicted Fe-Mo cluster-binding NifX family protein
MKFPAARGRDAYGFERFFKSGMIPFFLFFQGGLTMKIAVSSTGRDLNSQVDPRFGRCACFIIAETDDMSFETFDNENVALSGGAGIQSASFIASKGAVAVLTGNCGPNAMKAFSAQGVEVYTGQTGTVREAI